MRGWFGAPLWYNTLEYIPYISNPPKADCPALAGQEASIRTNANPCFLFGRALSWEFERKCASNLIVNFWMFKTMYPTIRKEHKDCKGKMCRVLNL
jgi:hypothetical protein